MGTGDRCICVRQADLPVPVIVEGIDGRRVVQELAPAGKNKVGAYVRSASEATVREALRRGRRS